MGKDRKKRTGVVLIKVKRAMPLLLWAVGIAFVCLVGGLVAKYVVSVPHGDNQIGANDFYFTLDLLAANEELSGQDENKILERTIHLYGAGQRSLTFQVQNFFDDLRINGKDVAYQLTWDDAVSVVEDAGTAVTKEYDYLIGEGKGTTKHARTYTATFTDTTKEQTAVITVRSVSPYEKEMKLTLEFHPEQYDVRYRVEDQAGAAYATLTVMVGKEGGVDESDLRFLWDQTLLQIDCTNTNIVEVDTDGSLTVPAGVAIGNTLNTRPIGESGSISVLFFKTDSTQNYSKTDTVAELDGEIYQILIGPQS